MVRFYGFLAWLCSSLALALLVCSLILVPDGVALGVEYDWEGIAMRPCPGDVCSVNCATPTCFDIHHCISPSNCRCNQPLPGCEFCECKTGRTYCYCGNR
jgi:hypothetical protein